MIICADCQIACGHNAFIGEIWLDTIRPETEVKPLLSSMRQRRIGELNIQPYITILLYNVDSIITN